MPAESHHHHHELRRAETTHTRRMSSTALPSELLEGAVGRLMWVALIYAFTHVLFFFIYKWISAEHLEAGHYPAHVGATVIAAVLGLAMAWAAWSKKFAAESMLDAGLLFQVAGGLLIGIGETLHGPAPGELVRGHSAIAIWTVFFVLVVPHSPGKAALAAFATALMGPLAMGFNIVVYGVATPSADQWLLMNMATFLMAAWAVILSRYVYRLGKEVNRARELGAYELVERIGAGGMGEVWVGRHRMLAREAAVKLIRREALCCDAPGELEAARKRFEREAQATAALHSPHTVQVHDYGVAASGDFYYVMELLDGLDLQALVERFGPQPAPRVVYILDQICDSLAEAHLKGLTHRDIKPRNLFLCRLGLNFDFVKVLDFGLVKVKGGADQSQLTREGATTGTPAYMSPEVALGRATVDGRADIYAVGCVAYWLLTGQLVFDADSALAMSLEHVQTKPAAPSTRTEIEVPPELDQLVLDLLAKDPVDRPATARELSRRLRAIPRSGTWTNEQAEEWWGIHMPSARASDAVMGGA